MILIDGRLINITHSSFVSVVTSHLITTMTVSAIALLVMDASRAAFLLSASHLRTQVMRQRRLSASIDVQWIALDTRWSPQQIVGNFYITSNTPTGHCQIHVSILMLLVLLHADLFSSTGDRKSSSPRSLSQTSTTKTASTGI